MLITITYRGEHTQDLGFLLHKNPYRPQSFKLAYGIAYVFYPEVSEEQTTAALLLDINPIELARGKAGEGGSGLFDYVNDRPYVCSSFMCSALSRVFGTALSGKCSAMQELADTALDLSAGIYNLPCQGNEDFVREVFEALGYQVELDSGPVDEKFPEWGKSRYVNLTIRGNVRLSELLSHLYVLIPAFDRYKHYYVTGAEIEKLLNHGKGWLSSHPAKAKIINRYFSKQKHYADQALLRLVEQEDAEGGEDGAEDIEAEDIEAESAEAEDIEAEAVPKENLNTIRLKAVMKEVLDCGAESVIDLGCGEGKLTAMLLPQEQIHRITAADISVFSLERAGKRMHYDRMSDTLRKKLALIQASLTYRDERFSGFDCACLVEVIEHIDLSRLPAIERNVFEFAAPRTVVLTTPNREYNAVFGMPEGKLRHSDHRFEWTREEFRIWTEKICSEFGYTVKIYGIGDVDENAGTPTQMGVFTKCR